tara:strand:- start:121 stop:780 length:660 start_codon:yes stop_codon:yes gene_type:complete
MSRWLFFPSTGLPLIIHDAFGGSGSLVGRTPDTVNNGNNWEVPESDTTVTVASAKAYRSASGAGSPDIYIDACRIDYGSSSAFKMDAIGTVDVNESIGFSVFNTDTTSTENSLTMRVKNTGAIDMFDLLNGASTPAGDRPSGSISAPNGTLVGLRCEYDGTYVIFSVWDTGFTSEVTSVSSADFTGGNFTTTPSAKIGLHFGGTVVGTANYYTDLKVYA